MVWVSQKKGKKRAARDLGSSSWRSWTKEQGRQGVVSHGPRKMRGIDSTELEDRAAPNIVVNETQAERRKKKRHDPH